MVPPINWWAAIAQAMQCPYLFGSTGSKLPLVLRTQIQESGLPFSLLPLSLPSEIAIEDVLRKRDFVCRTEGLV